MVRVTAPFVADAEALREARCECGHEALAWHRAPFGCVRSGIGADDGCPCGHDPASALLASGVVQPREDAVREALLAARDAWQWGEWANAPRCADRVQERLANAQHVTDWLTARAGLAPTGATTQGGA